VWGGLKQNWSLKQFVSNDNQTKSTNKLSVALTGLSLGLKYQIPHTQPTQPNLYETPYFHDDHQKNKKKNDLSVLMLPWSNQIRIF